MSERLTDAGMDILSSVARRTRERNGSVMSILVHDVDAMLTELRERRAADITPDDVVALAWLRDQMAEMRPFTLQRTEAVIAILDRLTTNGGKP
jgi:hypothetical protein